MKIPKIDGEIRDWYTYVPDKSDEKQWAIKLLKEPYEGVLFKYGLVGFKENADGTAVCQFEYDVIEVPQDLVEKELPDCYSKHFKQLLGLILNDTIMRGLNNQEKKDTPE